MAAKWWPTSQRFHQHKPSPTAVTKAVVASYFISKSDDPIFSLISKSFDLKWHQLVEVNYGTMEYFIDLNKEMISVVLKIFHQWAHTRNRTKYSFIYTNYIVQSIVICCSQEIAFETFIQLSDDFYFTKFKSFLIQFMQNSLSRRAGLLLQIFQFLRRSGNRGPEWTE